jgi:two-component system response regulator RegX3
MKPPHHDAGLGQWPPRVPVVHSHETLHACDIDIDRTAHRVTIRGEQVDLPLREFQLLELLVANANVVLTREQIVRWIWDDDPASNSLDVHVLRLRRKIETDPNNPVRLRTIRGLGYRFDSECSAPSCINSDGS